MTKANFNWSRDVSYNEAAKQAFHRAARKQLKLLAAELRLVPGSYDLRSNKAGIAISGEITLHADHVYVQVSQSCMGVNSGILVRTCKGRKDYCGGHNHFLPLTALDDIPAMAEKVSRIAPERLG